MEKEREKQRESTRGWKEDKDGAPIEWKDLDLAASRTGGNKSLPIVIYAPCAGISGLDRL